MAQPGQPALVSIRTASATIIDFPDPALPEPLRVVVAVPVPEDFPVQPRVAFDPSAEHTVIEIALPEPECIPSVKWALMTSAAGSARRDQAEQNNIVTRSRDRAPARHTLVRGSVHWSPHASGLRVILRHVLPSPPSR